MKILGLDVEISNVFDLLPGEDIDKYTPFDISVAATEVDGDEQRLWVSAGPDGKPKPHIERARALEFLQYLDEMQKSGHGICTWNGLSFDLRWIGNVAGEMELASRIARKMYDPMFQFFKIKGFPVSLAAVGKGMGISTTKTMNVTEAPRQWRNGNYKEVCEYVLGDVRMTIEIVRAIQKSKEIAWITTRGSRSCVPLQHLRTVEECLRDPMPNQSWMDTPIPEGNFTKWLRS